MIPRWDKFDPERDFIARKAVTFGDDSFAPGDMIDKNVVPLRRLRQLYEAKVLMKTDEEAAAAPIAEKATIDGGHHIAEKSLVDMTTDERRAWFEARGGKYDARWSDTRVLEAANGLS